MQPPPPAPGPAVAPWFPPPTYPPPHQPQQGGGDRRALGSLIAAILGIVLGLIAGLPGLVLGPVAYFMGKASVRKIEESKGALGGRGTATAGWMMGVAATVVGAVVSLIWIVIFFEALAASTTS